MQCAHAQELFSDYLSGEMDRPMAVSIENHLAACPACREEVAGLRRVWAALEQVPVVSPPPGFHNDLMRRLEAASAPAVTAARPRQSVRDTWRALFRPRQLAFAATVLIILLAGAEVFQARRAELGPIGWLLQSLRPAHTAQHMTTFQSEGARWQPGTTGGALVIRLRAPENADTDGLAYTVKVDGNATTLHAAERSDQEVVLTLPLSASPIAKTITVTVPPTNADSDPQTVPVTVLSSASAPSAP
ncbi:MAG TPA: zf-HC2 domain-containing protein [Chthonomonadaceae bacterium]|nr:zf-HC2 domain-containing protein [Chthonomonadaceae bacterium]